MLLVVVDQSSKVEARRTFGIEFWLCEKPRLRFYQIGGRFKLEGLPTTMQVGQARQAAAAPNAKCGSWHGQVPNLEVMFAKLGLNCSSPCAGKTHLFNAPDHQPDLFTHYLPNAGERGICRPNLEDRARYVRRLLSHNAKILLGLCSL